MELQHLHPFWGGMTREILACMHRLGLVALALCACTHAMSSGAGDNDGGGADAGPGSSNGSGSDNDTVPPTDVRVVVQDGYAPIAGVRVVFAGADGSTMELSTGADGRAQTAFAGGNVTVIRTYPTGNPQQYPEIYDYIAVKPGEALHVGHVTDNATPTTIQVAVPTLAQGNVKIVTPCGSGQGTAPTISVSVTACPSELSLYLRDGNQESFVATVPYATTIDVSHQTLNSDLSTTILTYDVGPGVSSVTAEGRAVAGMHQVYSTGAQRVDQASIQTNLPDLAATIDELVIGTIVATAGGTQMTATRSLWEPMPVSVDGTGALPYLQEDPVFTPTGVSWVETGSGTVDAVIATIEVTRSTAPSPADAKYTRTILAPYSGMSLAIPQLTGADATYNPTPADQLAGAAGLVGAVGSDTATGGYDALRPWAFGVANLVEAAPVGVSVTLSYAGTNPPTL